MNHVESRANENIIDESMLGKMTIENGMTLLYNNQTAAQRMHKHIFLNQLYNYQTTLDTPIILDCGSNIGVSAMWFKSRYPKAKLTCFEPDPKIFSILQENLRQNKLEDVEAINAAVTNIEGTIPFFGQLDGGYADSRGNSTIEMWGAQRVANHSMFVSANKLSNFVHSPIDLLKLNIEGAEQQVLEDLDSHDKLQLIHTIFLEVHDSDKISNINDINTIKSILEKNYTSVDIVHKDIAYYLPEEVRNWANALEPSLYFIKAEIPRGKRGQASTLNCNPYFDKF